mmetsp:Transcript_30872/g.77327  ORF Transcript_30872/g.77327 Transcript_30872/m.77327 type:complete len:216 (+) Transcript_30872:3-650(+)
MGLPPLEPLRRKQPHPPFLLHGAQQLLFLQGARDQLVHLHERAGQVGGRIRPCWGLSPRRWLHREAGGRGWLRPGVPLLLRRARLIRWRARRLRPAGHAKQALRGRLHIAAVALQHGRYYLALHVGHQLLQRAHRVLHRQRHAALPPLPADPPSLRSCAPSALPPLPLPQGSAADTIQPSLGCHLSERTEPREGNHNRQAALVSLARRIQAAGYC